jgi:mannose-6-phosphate isomerase
MRVVEKPWGSTDLRPWSAIPSAGQSVGEIWFERPDTTSSDTILLFKILFTEEALSIQVHPDDALARSLGMPNGKTEAWFVLAATPDARVAVGLTRPLPPVDLRAAIADQSIAGLINWRSVQKGDVVFVPAGMIHAIGPGLVIAEVQQRSDATFRLHDFGRGRAIHVDQSIAAASPQQESVAVQASRLDDQRTILVSGSYFTLERLSLAAGSAWALNAGRELWMLVIAGHGTIGTHPFEIGQVAFVEDDCVRLDVGAGGIELLVAYADDTPSENLLEPIEPMTVPVPAGSTADAERAPLLLFTTGTPSAVWS